MNVKVTHVVTVQVIIKANVKINIKITVQVTVREGGGGNGWFLVAPTTCKLVLLTD